MSANDLAGAASPVSAEEPGRESRRTASRSGAITPEQMALISTRPTLTFDESCAYTNVGRETLRKAIRAGQLDARRWGRKLVIRRADLDAFMDNLPSARGAA